MARGDAIFARCNVDWPNDPRCVGMTDNNTRWLNHRLWLWCTQHRSPVIPGHYTEKFMADSCKLNSKQFQAGLRSMGELEIISVSVDGLLVVEGVTNQNSKLLWKNDGEYPERSNPWKHDPKYLWVNGFPIPITTGSNGAHKGTNERERNIEREREIENAHATPTQDELMPTPFDQFWEAYPWKIGETSTRKAFKAIQWSESTIDEIITDVTTRSASKAWIEDNGEYIPKPTKYIKDKYWKSKKAGSAPIGVMEDNLRDPNE